MGFLKMTSMYNSKGKILMNVNTQNEEFQFTEGYHRQRIKHIMH